MNSKQKLTKHRIESASVPDGKASVEIQDTEIPALSIWIGSTKRTWRVRKWSSLLSKRISYTLGDYPAISTAEARQKALAVLKLIADGKDPNSHKRNTRDANNIRVIDVYQDYISSRALSANTLASFKTSFETYSKELLTKSFSNITEDYVKLKHAEISKRSLAGADAWGRNLRALYNFAMYEYRNQGGERIFRDNPVGILKHTRRWNNVGRRCTYLPREIIPKWLGLVRDLQGTQLEDMKFAGRRAKPNEAQYLRSLGDALELALLTGLRKSEVLSLPICQIDTRRKVFWIDKAVTKNRERLELPITAYTAPIFERRLNDNPYESEFLFSCYGGIGRITDPKKHIESLCDDIGFKWGWHDLRRTFQTASVYVGNSLYQQKRLMNHKISRSDVTEGYSILTAEELRAPAERVHRHLLNVPVYPIDPGAMVDTLLEEEKKALLAKLVALLT